MPNWRNYELRLQYGTLYKHKIEEKKLIMPQRKKIFTKTRLYLV